MSTMISEVYSAFKEAGVSEEKASAAAEALANYQDRFNRLESDNRLLKWMVTVNVGLSLAILLKLLT